MSELEKNFSEKKLKSIRHDEAEDLAEILAKKYNLPYTDLAIVPVHIEALVLVPEKESREAQLAPFQVYGRKVNVGILTPNNSWVKEVVGNLKRKGYNTEIYIVSQSSLENAWSRYSEISKSKETTSGMFTIGASNINQLVEEIKTTNDLKEKVKKEMGGDVYQSVTKILEIILAGAVATYASDIHIEPEEKNVRFRLRLDGVLQTIVNFEHHTYQLLLSRIKLLSGLKLNIKTKAQDGRYTIRIGKDDIEIRTSILPGAFGESVVMRLLNPNTVSLDISLIGMEEKMLSIMQKEINKPNGMILNTGPTGSGKTTTLYSFLKTVNRPGIKIITIEDPIEYHLEGISQTQVRKGYSFLDGLRAALRQDPDVIMVGEIRDTETAKIAINASLTGHLVLSTLHTNNAAGAIPRLLDLGVEIKVLGDAMTVTMAQRLLRKLCDSCKKNYPPTDAEKAILLKSIELMPADYRQKMPLASELKIFRADGCEKCNHTGYKGRTGIFEIILINNTVREAILKNPSEHDVWEASNDQGLIRMREHGIVKVIVGETSLEELARIVDLSKDS